MWTRSPSCLWPTASRKRTASKTATPAWWRRQTERYWKGLALISRRMFKAQYSMSPKKYILNARIVKAKELLIGTSCLSISEIACACGFTNLYHFDRTFKVHTGCSPTEYLQTFGNNFWYYFLIKILILIRKALPDGAASFVIYKERNHKTSLVWTPCPSGN